MSALTYESAVMDMANHFLDWLQIEMMPGVHVNQVTTQLIRLRKGGDTGPLLIPIQVQQFRVLSLLT
jgi:hypothetical protein